MELRFPKQGLSDEGPVDGQEPETTSIASNVRYRRDFDGREGGGQRAGQVKHTSAALVSSTKIAHLAEVEHDNPQTTYTALGSSVTVEQSTATPSIQDCRAVVRDANGNSFFLDGGTTIVKVNADLVVQWKIVLPASAPTAIVRSLAVDPIGRVFAGESDGVDPAKAKLWCYEQLEDKKTSLLWEIVPGYRTEWIVASGTTLLCAQNDSVNWRSRWALYAGLGVENPTLAQAAPCPYPINHVDQSPKDGAIGTSHEANSARGKSPKSPQTSAVSVDQVPADFLASSALRIWAEWDARDVDGNGSNNSEYADGDPIDFIGDKTGNGRSWALGSGVTAARLSKGAVAGQDALYFGGSTHFESAAPFSQDRAFRAIQRTAFPMYTGAQFVAVFAFKIPPEDSTTRYLLSLIVDDATASSSRVLLANRYVSSSLPGTTRRGNLCLYEDSTGSGSVADGTDDFPHTGVWDDDGLVLVTWVYDGGVDDVTGSPTRSCLRVNGRPCDRWKSRDFASLLADQIAPTLGWGRNAAGAVYPSSGWSKMLGYFLHGIVLSDWEESSSADPSMPFARQRLIEMPNYPDAGWSSGSGTELEKLEAWMAHSWGLAHKLPAGYFNRLEGTGTPADGNTVTIGSRVFTFRTALTPAANEVLIGGSLFAALTNLAYAINGTGTAGVSYATGTAAHASVRALGVPIESGGSNRTALYVQSRNGNGAAFSCAESSAVLAWDAATSIQSSLVAPNTDVGHFPHPYFVTTTPTAIGGPPSAVYGQSVFGALTSPYPMFVLWDGASGKAKNVLVTNGPGYSGIGVGGLGYCARFFSDGSIGSCGTRIATSTDPAVIADPIDVRRITYDGTSFSTTNSSTGPWEYRFGSGSGDELTYHWPRMDVDAFDNLYVPVFNGSEDKSLVVLAKNANAGGSFNGRTLCVVTTLTDDPQAYAVAVDPEYPDFPSAFTDKRAERVVLATRKEASGTTAVWDLRLVSAATAAAAQSVVHRVAVCGGALYEISSGGAGTLIDSSALASTARFIDSCATFGKLILVDGQSIRVWDPRAGTFGYLRARSGGKVPLRPMFTAAYRKRLVFARMSDRPHSLVWSAYDDIYGWDVDPPGDSPLSIAAVRSPLSTTGDFPDTMTGLAVWQDDLLLGLGGSSIFALRGDPGQGGQWDQAVKGLGVAFGRAHCWTPDGRFWFVTNQAELYSWTLGSPPQLVSRRFARTLANAIDFSVARPELCYSPAKRQIRIQQIPYGAGDTLLRHFVLDLDQGALFEDSYGTADVQPTAQLVTQGATPSARRLLLGSRDGYVREESDSAKSDDGVRIDSKVLIGPLHPQAADVEALYTNLRVLLAAGGGSARYELFASANPSNLGDAVEVGRLEPGRNTPSARVSGSWVGLMLTGSTALDHWGLDRATIDGAMAARQRPRGRVS